MNDSSMLQAACRRWTLSEPVLVADTASSFVYKACQADDIVALKLLKPAGKDEWNGVAMLHWWDGKGAVKLRGAADDMILMDWVDGDRLGDIVRSSGDGNSFTGIADLLSQLHATRADYPEGLQPLDCRLKPVLTGQVGALARHLLAKSASECPLHGDFHHDNIIVDESGWTSIDPKGVFGDPAYDCANLFLNPVEAKDLVHSAERIRALACALHHHLGYPVDRILGWAAVHCALSEVWAAQMGGSNLLPTKGMQPILLAAYDAVSGAS
ncbi:aminoglycoside phosphotransferase family protein [Halovulum sp. GXIMD14793]